MTVENPARFAAALGHAERGMDFADALHLGAAEECDAMLTFDRRFVEVARGASVRVAYP